MPRNLGKNILDQGRQRGGRCALLGAHRFADFGANGLTKLRIAGLIEHASAEQERAKAYDWVPLLPLLGNRFIAVSGGIIRRGVRPHAIGERLDEGRAAARASSLDRLPRYFIDRQYVV